MVSYPRVRIGPSQLAIIAHLSKVIYKLDDFPPWSATQRGIADAVGMSCPRVSGIVSRCVRNGHIAHCGLSRIRMLDGRQTWPHRLRYYRVTEAGMRLLEDA